METWKSNYSPIIQYTEVSFIENGCKYYSYLFAITHCSITYIYFNMFITLWTTIFSNLNKCTYLSWWEFSSDFSCQVNYCLHLRAPFASLSGSFWAWCPQKYSDERTFVQSEFPPNNTEHRSYRNAEVSFPNIRSCLLVQSSLQVRRSYYTRTVYLTEVAILCQSTCSGSCCNELGDAGHLE